MNVQRTKSSQRIRRAIAARSRATIVSALAVLLVLSAAAQALAQELDTIEPGKLIVGFNGDMPMTSLQDGQLIGTDGKMIAKIAADLGLEIVPSQADWAAVIESTTSGRNDVMLGAMGWTEERSKVMTITDPIYYFGTLLAQKTDTNYSTFADMAGKRVGTVTGFTLVPELKAVPGIGEARLYDTSDGVLRDLVAGRLDMAILDPPLVELAIAEHPEWELHQVELQPDPAFPIMSTKYNVVMGVRKEATALADAINAGIAELWATCQNQVFMAEYGVTNPSFFIPPDPNPRIGIDREEGWESPTLNPECDANAAGAEATPGT
ncbi:MAG: transporter substrate-binding protein [Thermomicrobiales bacterium]|jgi:ABC-type amino acid transport substrate-binding protein|nr:transporter substrate-binding protein [Thermomicrobiales bacterium]